MTAALALRCEPDGSFKLGNPEVTQVLDFPSVSGFELGAVALSPPAGFDPAPSVRWVASRQDAEGGWGAAWEYYGSEGYAHWAMARGLAGHNTAARRLRPRA